MLNEYKSTNGLVKLGSVSIAFTPFYQAPETHRELSIGYEIDEKDKGISKEAAIYAVG